MGKGTGAFVLIIAVSMIFGFILGQIAPELIPKSQQRLSDEAVRVLSKFTITVYELDGGTKTYTLSDKSPYVKILLYTEEEFMLSVNRPQLKWQLVIGFEDWASEPGKGDFADVIIKVFRFYENYIDIECGCLGGFEKEVKYSGQVVVDTRTGARHGRLLQQPVP